MGVVVFSFGGSFWDPIFDKERPRAPLTSCRLTSLPSIPFLLLKEVKPKSRCIPCTDVVLFPHNHELTAHDKHPTFFCFWGSCSLQIFLVWLDFFFKWENLINIQKCLCVPEFCGTPIWWKVVYVLTTIVHT